MGLSLSHFLLLWVLPLPPLTHPQTACPPLIQPPRVGGWGVSLSENICGDRDRTKLVRVAGDRGLHGLWQCFPQAETPPGVKGGQQRSGPGTA